MNTPEKELIEAMKNGMRRLVSGVSVLTSTDEQGVGYAMTVSSVTSLSLTPPSLLVCVNQETRIHPTLLMGREFSINVLAQAHQDISIACSTGEQNEQRLQLGGWAQAPGKPPELDGAEAIFNCIVDGLINYGSHDVVIGKVITAKSSSTPLNPLIYVDGAYASLNQGK